MSESEPEPRASWLRLLLLLPVAAMLWVPSYNRIDPVILGLPFFYAYQLMWGAARVGRHRRRLPGRALRCLRAA